MNMSISAEGALSTAIAPFNDNDSELLVPFSTQEKEIPPISIYQTDLDTLPLEKVQLYIDQVAARFETPTFNTYILRQIPDMWGQFAWKWQDPQLKEGMYDGSTKDVVFENEVVLHGYPKDKIGSDNKPFCHGCGLTMQLCLSAYQKMIEEKKIDPVASFTADEVKGPFKKEWFVEQIEGDGPGIALKNANLGACVPKSEAQPGDFVQFWRHPTPGKGAIGGVGVFMGWKVDSAQHVVGLYYFSAFQQGGTVIKALDFSSEDEKKPGTANMACVYFSRLYPHAQCNFVPRNAIKV